jgi:hypothetical protein
MTDPVKPPEKRYATTFGSWDGAANRLPDPLPPAIGSWRLIGSAACPTPGRTYVTLFWFWEVVEGKKK